MSRRALGLVIAACCLLATVHAVMPEERATLRALDAQAGDSFGSAVSVSADTALVSAPDEDSAGEDAGAAYVFMRHAGGQDAWGQVKKLQPSDGQSGDRFGSVSVAVAGDRAAVGAWQSDTRGNDAGAAYVFERHLGGQDNWGEAKALYATDAAASDRFGYSVAMAEDTVLVGALSENSGGTNAGAVYVFDHDQGGAGNWGQVKKLASSDISLGDQFGKALALDADTAIIGANFQGSGATGAAYVFERHAGGQNNWGETRKLQAPLPDRNENHLFGQSVAIAGDTAVIGASSNGSVIGAGAAYVFERNHGGAGAWGHVAVLRPSDTTTGDAFGSSVSIVGDTVLVGANNAAYLFERHHGGANAWGEVTKLQSAEIEAGDNFGRATALSGRTAVFGASGEDTGGNGAGAAYVFELASPDDGDGLPADWETTFGLDPTSGTGDDGPGGDPDGDGKTNVEEYQNGTHPRGFFTRYFAEGATGVFFDTSIALVNLHETAPAAVLLRFQRADGSEVAHHVAVGPLTRGTVDVETVTGMAQAEFSTVVESDHPIVADRTMRWDGSGYGSHAETSIPAPATTWYLAEGATHSGFNLFYLIQNPNAVPTSVTVTYLLPAPAAPVVRAYQVNANARFNIWVDTEPGLDHADVSAVLQADAPIIVERAMYLDQPGRLFGAGHESAGITTPATEWFMAEGATGTFFDLFVLIANPGNAPADVTTTFLLPTAPPLVKQYTVAPLSRFNIWVDTEDVQLADTAVSTIVTSTNGVPIIVERAMWWPGPTSATWAEAHNAAGLTSTGRTFALAEGEVGGPTGVETYVLIANRGAADTARVTLLFEDGTQASKNVPLPASSRTNVNVAFEFPGAVGRRFGVIVEALGATPAIVVERAMYSNAAGVTWAAGTNAVATRLQ